MCSDKTLFDSLESRPVWGEKEWGIAKASAHTLFNPSSAIDQDRLFSGRSDQVSQMLEVIYERGAHAILYGERGVGKSSLANTITQKVPPSILNLKFIKENCRPDDTFFTLWSKMLWNFEYEGQKVDEYLKNETREFVVVDSLETKRAMADTIKQFSDYPKNITIIIVGVGFSILELFGAHPSIQRCCRQIAMPRMDPDELSQIVTERYAQMGISASVDVINLLVDLSQGLPGFVHLLGREAALSALERKSRVVEKFDCDQAIRSAVDKAQEYIVSTYNKAVYSPKDNLYKEVLLACALADTDDRGKFSASSVRDKLSKILGRQVEISHFARHLASFCEDRGPILRKTGKPKGFQYQFIEAPLQPYIIMRGKKDELI